MKPIAWMNQHGAVTQYHPDKWLEIGHTLTALYTSEQITELTDRLMKERDEIVKNLGDKLHSVIHQRDEAIVENKRLREELIDAQVMLDKVTWRDE